MLIKKMMKAISSAGDSRVRQWALEVARFRPGKPLGTWPSSARPSLQAAIGDQRDAGQHQRHRRQARAPVGCHLVQAAALQQARQIALGQPQEQQAGQSQHEAGRVPVGPGGAQERRDLPPDDQDRGAITEPLITGRDRKLAMKPRRSTRTAAGQAADEGSWAPGRYTGRSRVGQRRQGGGRHQGNDGHRAHRCVMLLPNKAYSTGGRMLA